MIVAGKTIAVASTWQHKDGGDCTITAIQMREAKSNVKNWLVPYFTVEFVYRGKTVQEKYWLDTLVREIPELNPRKA